MFARSFLVEKSQLHLMTIEHGNRPFSAACPPVVDFAQNSSGPTSIVMRRSQPKQVLFFLFSKNQIPLELRVSGYRGTQSKCKEAAADDFRKQVAGELPPMETARN